jgi:pimeloyl-ACP methyl ester carboxylesterase
VSGAGRVRRPPDDFDARALAWLTAPEGASSRGVLDATFSDLGSVRQEPWRPWTPLLDALSRPASVELPRWAWIAVVLLLLMAVSIATLTAAGQIRPWLDRLSALPAEPAALAEVECPGPFAAAGDVRCRMATVPQRHELSSGPSVRVLVAEFPTSDAAAVAGADPLLTPISLDPSGERTVVDLAATARSLGRPVIGVAARGTGASEPSLGCPELEAVPTPADPVEMAGPAWRETLAGAVRGCRERLTATGIDVTAYGLAQQAADLESIRQGLGVDRWMVRTFGDDSLLALELIRRYPDHVAGVVLLGPSFPGENPVQATLQAVPASVEALTALCDADEFCAGRYRRPSDVYAAAMRGEDASVVARAVRSTLAGSATAATLPSHLDQVAAGDIAWASDLLVARGWCLGYQLACSAVTGWTGGAEFSTVCLGRVPPASATPVGTENDAFGVAGLIAADPWDVICNAWVGDTRDVSTTRSVSSDVPVLAIAVSVDPFHALASTTEGMRDLSRGVLRVAPWAPEGTSGGCLTAGATAWLDDPLATLPAACPLGEPIPFADAP